MKYKNFILPDPPGYYLLVEMDSEYLESSEEDIKGISAIQSKTSSLYIPTKTAQRDNYSECIATVIAVGEACYGKDFKEKTGSTKPWAKPGDIVMLQSNSGRIVQKLGQSFVHGQFQLVTDQAVCGVYDQNEFKKLQALRAKQ